jgi:hypothetical protein
VRRLALAATLAACGCGDNGPRDPQPPGFEECAGSNQSFVRQASLAVLGRRPLSQAETQVYADLMSALDARAAAAAESGAPPPPDPREVVVRALAREPGYADRWTELMMDALKVPRIETQNQQSCYGVAIRESDAGELAAYVRDNPGTAAGTFEGPFSMRDLVQSAIRLDDVSVIYRAHLFALVSRPIAAANVGPEAAELARREDFGLVFDAAYLNRDIVCLGCHNSDASITDSTDPALDRHWPLAGGFERALYGSSTGVEPARAHAPFRFDGFVGDLGAGAAQPWGWSSACGEFTAANVDPDIAGVDGLFAGLSGDRLTVYDLERTLKAGFETIADRGLGIAADNTIDDPAAALAYLVAASAVESVWREVIGAPLTIANYFPRTQASRDLLAELTEVFVASRFSLEELLVAIARTPYFNRLPPSAGCGAGPYNMPPVYDPWVIADADPERRLNGAGDAVVPLSARTTLRAAYEALEWERPPFYEFPEEPFELEVCESFFTCREMATECVTNGSCCVSHQILCVDPPAPGQPGGDESQAFQKGIGAFLKNGERGFRGLDFQARLVFESRFGSCVNPGEGDDFVSRLVGDAVDRGETVGEVVAALKDRLVGVARVSHRAGTSGISEREAIERMLGASLTGVATDAATLEGPVRQLCGVLLSSPQFLLTGLGGPDGAYVPRLTAGEHGYAAVCQRVAALGDLGVAVSCAGGRLTLL